MSKRNGPLLAHRPARAFGKEVSDCRLYDTVIKTGTHDRIVTQSPLSIFSLRHLPKKVPSRRLDLLPNRWFRIACVGARKNRTRTKSRDAAREEREGERESEKQSGEIIGSECFTHHQYLYYLPTHREISRRHLIRATRDAISSIRENNPEKYINNSNTLFQINFFFLRLKNDN